VRAAHAGTGTDHDRVVDLALLDLAARDRVLDGHLDDVTDVRVAALGAAQHLDAHHFLGAGVVGGLEVALYLDHVLGSLLRRARDDFDHAPVLGLGQRPALGDANDIAFVAGVVLVMRVELGRTPDVLAVQGVLDLALDEHGDGLVHLVADDAAFDRTQLLGILAHGSPLLLLGQYGRRPHTFAAYLLDAVRAAQLARGVLHAQRELILVQVHQVRLTVSRR